MLNSTVSISALFADWTLVVFTVFAQFAAGTALFASVSNYFQKDDVAKKFWYTSFATMVIAGIVSMLHLQNPFNALYTITQIGHSWLSREILSVGLFSGLVFLQLLKPNKALGYIASIMGLILVFVISQVYSSVAAMPLWSNIGTFVAFLGTSLLLGGAYALIMGRDIENPQYRYLAISSLILGLVFSLGAKLSWINVFIGGDVVSIPTEFASSLCIMIVQFILVIIGLFIVLPKSAHRSCFVLNFGFCCFLFAELSSRIVFFLAQLKIGV